MSITGYKFLRPELAERLRSAEVTVRRSMDGSHQGMHHSSAFGSSVEFAEYREYQPGDPINLIDWPVYARSDKYVIRQYHEDVSIRCFILLDISQSMQYQHKGSMSKMDFACHLAGGLMYMLTGQGDTVSLMTFDSKLRDHFEPSGSFAHLRPMLEHLEKIESKQQSDIESSLHLAAELIKGKAMVVVISDLLEEPDLIRRGIDHLYHDGKDLTVFHVLDPGELSLPDHGMVDVVSMETNEKIMVDLRQVRNDYLQQVRHYMNEIRSHCTDRRVYYHIARTDLEIHDVLLARSSKK
ncbi:MAG: DUF58 domain-containing protein [Phycisphaerae bacterium]|nr:DUF58 domain-containing protein [Phycisphaerae bacterium]